MKAAIVYINENEKKLVNTKYLDTNLLENTINKLNNTSVDIIYLVNCDYNQDNIKSCKTVQEAFEDIDGRNGASIVVSPFYPELDSYHYEALFQDNHEACVFSSNDELLKIYKLNNNLLGDIENLKYFEFKIESKYLRRIENITDLVEYSNKLKLEINNHHIEMGVNIIDPNNTYIGKDVKIEKDVTIYPNVFIEGKCHIGKNTTITSGSHLINCDIGSDNTIISSRIDSSIIHNENTIGPNSHIRMNSEIFNKCRIGNFVEFKNTKFNDLSRCAHLTYLGDCEVGEDVNIGCGVVTVNYDGIHKFHTTIKDHAFVGSNANLIAPVTIGEYAVVAAGSTITQDVGNKDMAIARSRQVVKEGRGYKYIKKEK